LDQELEFENGSGTKFGVGFTGLPFVNINFEMRQGTWDQYILNDTTVKEATKFNTFMIGISIPFTL